MICQLETKISELSLIDRDLIAQQVYATASEADASAAKESLPSQHAKIVNIFSDIE